MLDVTATLLGSTVGTLRLDHFIRRHMRRGTDQGSQWMFGATC